MADVREEKRTSADNRVVYRLVNAGVVLTALAAALVSWNGLVFVGAWAELPAGLTWLMPLMIDLPIIVFTLGGLARRSRGESHWLFSLAGYALTSVSAAANFLHVVSVRGLGTLEGVVGSCLSSMAPVLVLLTTEAMGALLARPGTDPAEAGVALDDLGEAVGRARERIDELDERLAASRVEVEELEPYRDHFGRAVA